MAAAVFRMRMPPGSMSGVGRLSSSSGLPGWFSTTVSPLGTEVSFGAIGERRPLFYLEKVPQSVSDEIDGEDRGGEESAGKQDDPERALHVGASLGHDVAPGWDVGRRARAEKRQIRLEQHGRGADIRPLHDEGSHESGQDIDAQD